MNDSGEGEIESGKVDVYLPGLSDHDVVERCIAFAKASESNSKNHLEKMRDRKGVWKVSRSRISHE